MPSEEGKEVRKPPVSVTFFSGAIKLLCKQHGDRDASSLMENLRGALGEAEMFFKAMPLVEKKNKKSVHSANRGEGER